VGKHQTSESKGHYAEDHTLVGLLNVITILFESDNSVLTSEEVKNLATMLLEGCLFSFEWQPIEAHITPEIDLGPIEKKSVNKCQAKNSTLSAYRLLIALCKSQVVPGLTDDIIQNYWIRQIHAVDKP
jgi:hypothetical protein